MGIQNLIIERDLLLVIEDIEGVNRMFWHETPIIRDARTLLNRFNEFNIQNVYREENHVVDNLVGYEHEVINL